MTEAEMVVLATSGETEGAYGLVMMLLPPYHSGVSVHQHARFAEGIYVLTGTLAVTVDQSTLTLMANRSMLIEPGVMHSLWNPSAAPVQLLLIFTPGGSEAELLLASGTP